MERYIKTYPKIFSKQECDGIIEYFNIQKINKNITHTELKDHRHFDEINLNDFRDETLDTQMGIYERFKGVLTRYKKDAKLHTNAWPENFKFEEIRLKHYRTGRGNFLDHVDVGSYDSANRFLVLFVYLNDVEKGGETEFYYQKLYELEETKYKREFLNTPKYRESVPYGWYCDRLEKVC
mgnify:CR=1 FL=1